MPLLWLSLSFLLGILLGDLLAWPLVVWLTIAVLFLAFIILRRLLTHFFPLFASHLPFYAFPLPVTPAPPLSYPLLLAVLALGAARCQSVQPVQTPASIAWYNDQPTTFIVQGVVVEMPDQRDAYTNLRLQVEALHPLYKPLFTPVQGLVLAKVPPGGDWRYGDRLSLQGRLQTPFENEEFSYRNYLARRGVYSVLSCYASELYCVQLIQRGQGNPVLTWIYTLRGRLLDVVYRLFPDPEASLLGGILLGIDSGIPENVQEAFKVTGTAHIIAISGFNIVIVAGVFAVFFNKLLGRWRGMLATILAIAFYSILAGGGASVVRAAVMGGLAVLAANLGRRQNGLTTLAFVAALMALADPNVLWDVSFQLSFLATLGLVLYADPLTQAFKNFVAPRMQPATVERLAGPVGEFFLFTLAAQLTTFPIMLYYFQRLSLVSLIANPLVLPVQPPVMVLGGLAAILGLVYLPLGRLVAYLAWPFVVYTIRMVELLAQVPGAAWSVSRVSLLAVICFYAILLAWTFFGTPLRQWAAAQSAIRPHLPGYLPGLVLIVLAVAAVLAWQLVLAVPDGRLHLTMLDVGSGDALLVQTPTGRNLLIDGGPSSTRLSDSLGRRMPLLRRDLDYLVVAGAGEEQLTALSPILGRFSPAQVLWSGLPAGTYQAGSLRADLSNRRLTVLEAQSGQVLSLGAGASLQVLAVTRNGAVLLLEWGDFRALLPVGLDADSLQALQNDRRLGPITALMLAASGDAALNPPGWIARWSPQVVLLSVGAGDTRGRPDPETMQTIHGYSVLRTDQNGWVELSTDGKQMWVEVEKK